MTGSQHTSWRNPRLLLCVGLIFLCGALTGAVAMRFGVHSMLHKPEPYWQEGGRQIALQRFTKELDLTPAQARQLETVLDDFMKYVQTLQAQMDEVRADGKQRILKILDENQKKKFERMIGDLQQARRPEVR